MESSFPRLKSNKKIGQIKKILNMYTTFTFGNCKEMIVGDILPFKAQLWQTKCLFLLDFTNNLKEILPIIERRLQRVS